MTYTVISATYATADHTSAVVMTAEAGAVAISERDRPELWAQLERLAVAPYVPPAPAAPKIDTDAKIAALQAQIDALMQAVGAAAGGAP